MRLVVGTTAIQFDMSAFKDARESGVVFIVQNLGPGNVYIDNSASVSLTTGLKIGPNGAYEFPRLSRRPLWVISDSPNTDVRYFGID